MEPNHSNISPEAMPQVPESQPGSQQVEQGPSKSGEKGKERLADPEKIKATPADSGLTLPPVQLPTPPQVTAPSSDDDSDDDMPAVADDVDVIEQQWVNKAKKIIQETRDNPYEQEKAVEKLQIEYLKKRYGKDIKQARSE